MNFSRYYWFMGCALCIFLTACGAAFENANKTKPRALGKMNEIIIIADDTIWEGSLGDSLDYYFGGPFPITPRPEPIFDLRHFSTTEIMSEPLRRQLRTYLVVANLNDEDSPTTIMVREDLGEDRFQESKLNTDLNSAIGKDKWAIGQILIYLVGSNEDELADKIKKNFSAISNRIYEHDQLQLESSTFSKGENKGLSKVISEYYNIQIKIPLGYEVAQENKRENFTWLRNELKDGTISLIFKKMPYRDADQITKEYAKNLRDEYGRKYISSTQPNSYMVTNDVDLPMFEYPIDLDGLYTREYRGIWEMENDFMGGPFSSYIIINEKFGELLFIDGFVYRPGRSKRNLVQQMDFVIKNIKSVSPNLEGITQ